MYDSRGRKVSPLPTLPPGREDAFLNPWQWDIPHPPPLPPRTTGGLPSMQQSPQTRPRSAGDEYEHSGISIAFPQPQISRSASQLQNGRPHLYSQFDIQRGRPDTSHLQWQPNTSVTSFASYNTNDYWYEADEDDTSNLVKGLSDMSLQSEEGLLSFQAGELPYVDEEWHRLVPPEAQEVLGKQEVQRQSVIFELVKSEREYVADLEAVNEVFIESLRKAQPPVIQEPALSLFINEVFGNIREIFLHHKRMLAALFDRQREQHPLIQSTADIILNTTLKSDFRDAYETYIKHYPLAESHHRKQLKGNRSYETFIHSVSDDPRIRRRDLITFLSRPVTRLPRLNLLLEKILKLTDTEHDHPDSETLPIILEIMRDLIKSTQPGIEAAESKVKFWALCESLVFQKAEIIDMDLYDESRSLIYIGPVMRRLRSDTGLTEKWTDLVAALLDNYFILVREEKRPNGAVARMLVSRPIPLSFLRLGSFEDISESRREKSEEGGLFESFRSQSVAVYPFTVYHAPRKLAKQYTLYVTSVAIRKKWKNAFVDTIGVHKVYQDSNMWFSPQVVSDGFFRLATSASQGDSLTKVTGKITCAVPFVNGSKRFIAVGCESGIYVAPNYSDQYFFALNHKNATSLSALTSLDAKIFNRLVVHVDSLLFTYSLDILARIGLGQSQQETLSASVEKLTNDPHVAFCKHLHIGERALLVYASKRRLGSAMTVHVLEAVHSTEQVPQPQRNQSILRSLRTYGEPGYVPKDAYDAVALVKTIGICTGGGIITADPSNLARSAIAVVPDLQNFVNNRPMAMLKLQVEGAKPLGFIRVNPNELLVIYDILGCYIDKHGVPTRLCGYIKWETKVTSYANRNGHVLLISPEFIEIRNITTGRIVQAIKGEDIRLLYSGPYTTRDDPVLVVMRGKKDDKDGQSEKIMELRETEEISLLTPAPDDLWIWGEWDI